MEKLNPTRFNELGFYKRDGNFFTLSIGVIDRNEKINLAILDIRDTAFKLEVYSSETYERLYENNGLNINDDMEVIAPLDKETAILKFGSERLILKNNQIVAFTDFLKEIINTLIAKRKGGNPTSVTTTPSVSTRNCDTVTFLDRKYDIPTDLAYYVELFTFFDNMQNDLINTAMRIIKSVGYLIFQNEHHPGCTISMYGLRHQSEFSETAYEFALENLATDGNMFTKYTDKVIEMLYDHGIYTKSRCDYLANNVGLKSFYELDNKSCDYYIDVIT